MVRLHQYVPNSDKSGYYLQDSRNEENTIYQISNDCEDILLSFGYEDEDPIADEVFYILYDLEFAHADGSTNSSCSGVGDIGTLNNSNDADDLSNKDRDKFLHLILSNSELSETVRYKLEEYAKEHNINMRNEGHMNLLSNEELDGNSKHVEPRLLCEFCSTDHNATELLEHVAYSDDESHGSSGNVPPGFHPATASVIEEGTVQVAFPTQLRTNADFHPVCRWCGQKFYRIDRYLDHMNSNRESFDEGLHQATQQRDQTPLLVPFDRNGSVIPTTPSLSELTEETALENIFDSSDIPLDVANQTKPNNMDSDNVNLPTNAGFGIGSEECKDFSNNTDADISQVNTDGGDHFDTSENNTECMSMTDNNSKCDGGEMNNTFMKGDEQINKTTEVSDEKMVQIDSVLLALIDLVVADDTTDYNSRADLLDVALEEFLGTVIVDDHMDFEHQITTERYIDVETDPALRFLLQKNIQNQDRFGSSEEFIQHTVLDALGIDSSTTKIVVPNYDRYAFVIERLVQNDDCPYNTPSNIIHTSIEKYFKISEQ